MAVDDLDLVLAARSGDQSAWAGIYDRYADRLHDFCWSVLRDRDEAADATHDTFITAYRKLDQLRDPTRLRSWLFAIARNEALGHRRRQKRAVPTEELEVTATGHGPDEMVQTEELRQLVWAAAAGLAARDRAALDLHLRQGLEGAALGEALGTSADNANVLMSRLRDQVERALGAYLVAKRGRADCAGLDGLLKGWDGEFTPLWRKRIARHVDDCPTCDDKRRRMVSPLALLAGVAVVPAPLHLRDRVLRDMELISSQRPLARKQRRAAATRGAMAAGVALLLGVALWRDHVTPDPASRLSTAPTIGDLLASPPTSLGETTTSGLPGAVTATTLRTPTTRGGVVVASTSPPIVPPTAPPTTAVPVPPTVRASSGSGAVVDANQCSSGTTTPVTATVSGGTPPIGAVTLFWQGPGATSGSRRLNGSGSTFTGSLGPFFGQGTVTWWVVARDAAGAQGRSANQTITVTPCPG